MSERHREADSGEETVWAVVPARGGSEGIPGKNLALVGDRSLLCRAIACGLHAACVERTIVSTDDETIAEAGRKCGAEVPFLRPSQLARADTPGIAPIQHVLEWAADHGGGEPDWIVCLQPTSPFREAHDVDAAFDRARSSGADAVVSVADVRSHPYWTKGVDADGFLHPFVLDTRGERSKFLGEEHVAARRQDLPAALAPNGAVYLARASVIRSGSFYGERTAAYRMPPERSLDVDLPWDLRVARAIAAEKDPCE